MLVLEKAPLLVLLFEEDVKFQTVIPCLLLNSGFMQWYLDPNTLRWVKNPRHLQQLQVVSFKTIFYRKI